MIKPPEGPYGLTISDFSSNFESRMHYMVKRTSVPRSTFGIEILALGIRLSFLLIILYPKIYLKPSLVSILSTRDMEKINLDTLISLPSYLTPIFLRSIPASSN
jgi:hypothetical protein